MQEQELFQNYELKNWSFSPRLYKILGTSAILNIFVFVLLAQANFLTAKSCDTPFVSGVCTVLDTLYVGAMIADTDAGYVSEDYQKTELEDADVTFINLTGQTPPLEYPAGYFALANPEQQAKVMNVNEFPTNTTSPNYIPGITNNPTITKGTTPNLTTQPQVTPRPNKNPVIGDLPSSVTSNDTTTVRNRNRNRQNQTTTTQQNQTTSQNNNQTTTQNNTTNNQTSEKVNEANINKKVLKDFAAFVKTEVDNKKVDLNQPFKVVVEGVLTKDGKFDISKDSRTLKAKTQFYILEGDPQITDIAKKALEAIGDSGWLIYLRNLDEKAENFKITLIQDGEKIFARIEIDMKDENKAKTVASGLNNLLWITKNNTKLDEDARILINGAQTPTSNGNICILDFAIPKADAQAMIERNLKKLETTTPKTENQNKSTTQSVNSQTTAK